MPIKKPDISHEALKFIFAYNPEGKCLERLNGKRAKHVHKSTGWRMVYVLGKQIPEQYVAWYLHHGEWPTGVIIHNNGNRLDNSPENLRQIDAHRAPSRRSKSGWSGIHWHERTKRYRITLHGAYIGVAKTLEEAKAKQKLARLGHTDLDFLDDFDESHN